MLNLDRQICDIILGLVRVWVMVRVRGLQIGFYWGGLGLKALAEV